MEVSHPSSQHPLLEERHAMPIEPGRDHSPRLLFGSFLSKSEEWDGICTFVNISTPNVSVGRSRSGFYFRPTSPGLFWYFFGTSSHLPPVLFRWFFFVPPPPHRFSFASPSHTTKKILTDHNFPCVTLPSMQFDLGNI